MPTFRRKLKGKKCFFVKSLRLSDHNMLRKLASSSSLFSRFSRSLIFRTSNFWSLRNLIKQLFHSHLLDMRLVIANSALRASLAIYHLISNARSWNTGIYHFLSSPKKGSYIAYMIFRSSASSLVTITDVFSILAQIAQQ